MTKEQADYVYITRFPDQLYLSVRCPLCSDCSKCRLDWKVGRFKYSYQNNCYLVNISPAVKKIDRCNLNL